MNRAFTECFDLDNTDVTVEDSLDFDFQYNCLLCGALTQIITMFLRYRSVAKAKAVGHPSPPLSPQKKVTSSMHALLEFPAVQLCSHR